MTDNANSGQYDHIQLRSNPTRRNVTNNQTNEKYDKLELQPRPENATSDLSNNNKMSNTQYLPGLHPERVTEGGLKNKGFQGSTMFPSTTSLNPEYADADAALRAHEMKKRLRSSDVKPPNENNQYSAISDVMPPRVASRDSKVPDYEELPLPGDNRLSTASATSTTKRQNMIYETTELKLHKKEVEKPLPPERRQEKDNSDSNYCKLVFTLFIGFVALLALIMIILVITGVISAKCSECDNKTTRVIIPTTSEETKRKLAYLTGNLTLLTETLNKNKQSLDNLRKELTEQKQFNQNTSLYVVSLQNELKEINTSNQNTSVYVVSLQNELKEINTSYTNTSIDVLHLRNQVKEQKQLVQHLTNKLSNQTILITTLYSKVNNVSYIKGDRGLPGFNGTQGPRGPPSQGFNISACDFKLVKNTGTVSVKAWAKDDAKKKTKMNANCGFRNAIAVSLVKFVRPGTGVTTYYCECFGPDGTTDISCFINHWNCPE